MNEANLQTSLPLPSRPLTPEGTDLYPPFFQEGVSPYDEVQWERRTASITDTKGNTIFEQKDVEVPVDWSMTATNIVASKYLHGQMGTPERETGVRQLVGRVAETIRDWGMAGGYFATAEDARHLPRRAGAHAADAEGGLQLAGVVQRGLRPAGAGFRRAELALGPGDGRGAVLGHRLPESAVLGLLHQRGGRLAGLDSDAGQDRGNAVQVGLGHGDEPVVDPRVDGAAFGRRPGIGTVELHARV